MTQSIQLQVSGMSCGHCVNAVESSVGELNGVESVKVTLDAGLVDVAFDDSQVSVESIKNAIVEEGYTVA
ncbi:copper chaperone CopZ [Kurthia sibirica]|uniref:Copper chaperone CopZ n=1 Tax=Kurthia sibirica TaxID=202750 RepID=A0A2U3AK41_9BACL|nr:copper chaperone CopZ [Kurthia sibirica]PWI24902.1 copper resistance protein CopZ [Kurthia sibirica]GEK33189.1 copper chaperone CopZ [Kurthia sibirica]